MTKEDELKQKEAVAFANKWADWFVANPFFSLYQKKDYETYKRTITTANSFLADKDKLMPIDEEDVYNLKCEILEALIDEGWVQIVDNKGKGEKK